MLHKCICTVSCTIVSDFTCSKLHAHARNPDPCVGWMACRRELSCGVLAGVGAFAVGLALYKGVQYVRNRGKVNPSHIHTNIPQR